MSSLTLTPTASWFAFGGLFVLNINLLRRRTILAKLPVPPGEKWFFGHFKNLVGPEGLEYQRQISSTCGPTVELKGLAGRQALFTIDPAVVHTVQIKDKDKFQRAKGAIITVRAIFGGGLLALSPDEHRLQRKLLNPVFNMKHLRELPMPIFMGIAKETTNVINKELESSIDPTEVDIFPWTTAAALDLIGEAGLGYSFNSFAGERNEYSTAIKKVTQSLTKIGPFLLLLPFIHKIWTSAFRQWILDLVPFKTIQRLRHPIKLHNEQAEEIICARQALLSAGNDLSSEAGRGKNVMTLLMKVNESEGSGSHIDHQPMVGHMNVFIFAGHETTSNAVTRILDILAQRRNVQARLRDALRQYFEGNPNDTHHDGLLELPYLDGIAREVLRLFPPVSNIPRTCVEDTVLSLDYPTDTTSGKITSIPIKKGTAVILKIVNFNRNEAIWGKQANEFLPERRIESKVDEVTQPGFRLPGVYSSMMTFGSGSYACMLILEVMLAELITHFNFEPADQECTWANVGLGFPYALYEKEDLANPDKSPKFFLKVTRIET